MGLLTRREFELQQGQPQPTQPSKPGLLQNILGDIVRPFAKTGQTLLGGGFEIGRAGLSLIPGMGDKFYINPQTGAVVQNPFYSQQELEQISEDPLKAILEQAKQSAAVASYADCLACR